MENSTISDVVQKVDELNITSKKYQIMSNINRLQNIALYIFVFSINFEMLEVNDNFSVTKFAGILYIITILPQIQSFFSIQSLKPVLLPVIFFFVLLTINNLININELYNEVISQSMMLNVLFFILMINHVRKDYLILEKALLFFALGSIFLTLFFILGIGTNYDIDGRLTIFGDNENGIGLKISAALIIILVTIFQNRLKLNWFRFLMLIPLPFMLKFLAETGSRVSVISFALAFALGVVLIKTDAILKKVLIYLVGGIIFFIIIVQLMQTGVLVERLLRSSDSGDLGGRALIWERIIPLIKDHPIFGVGNTGYDFFYMSNFGLNKSPHNVILEILCYTGIVGLIFYSTFLFQIFLRGYQSYSKNGWLLPLVLLSPILGMIISGQILHFKIGWMIFAYIVSSSAIPYIKAARV